MFTYEMKKDLQDLLTLSETMSETMSNKQVSMFHAMVMWLFITEFSEDIKEKSK